MKVLVIDDDRAIRAPILLNYWLSIVDEYQWFTSWPENFIQILEDNPSITCISLDHDLGTSEVSRELYRLFMTDYERFENCLKSRTIVVHSMNPVGAERIKGLVEPYCKSVKIIPLSNMK